MFTQFYDLFTYFTDLLSPMWRILNTPVSSLPLIEIGDGFFDGLAETFINALIPILQSLATALFGDITLMQFVLFGSIILVISVYIIKFILSAIPVA